MEWITAPWPWYLAGAGIAVVMALLTLFEKSFGVSSNLRSICSMMGAGRCSSFFKFNWRTQVWNLVFIAGAVLGGFLAHQYLSPSHQVAISESTSQSLKEQGFDDVGSSFVPDELFGPEALGSPKGIMFLLVGGLLIGFGTRYAGGCTSGHAITGLSNLQVPSLIAVVGFFIGGLVMTHLLLPDLIQWLIAS